MRIILFSLTLLVWLAACKDSSPTAPSETAPVEQAAATPQEPSAKPNVAEISVEDADRALQSGALAVDANSEDTRKSNGTVPGAIILSSSSKYELSQLPEDKSKDLIFYCSNTKCTASDAAAERASANGYQSVQIMREGIKGWKDAGKATTAYPRS